MIPDEVMPYLNILGPRVQNSLPSGIYSSMVVTLDGNLLVLQCKVLELLTNPYYFCTTSSSTKILNLRTT